MFATDQIKIGARHRKDLGDIPALARSILELGLLHPIGITPAGELIFGRRRLEAYRRLGRKKTPVRIFDLDNTHRLLAERDENTERKAFAPTEAVAIGRAIEQRLRPVAEQRLEHGARENHHLVPATLSSRSPSAAL
jgi:ParB family chromosome partitioning protein